MGNSHILKLADGLEKSSDIILGSLEAQVSNEQASGSFSSRVDLHLSGLLGSLVREVDSEGSSLHLSSFVDALLGVSSVSELDEADSFRPAHVVSQDLDFLHRSVELKVSSEDSLVSAPGEVSNADFLVLVLTRYLPLLCVGFLLVVLSLLLSLVIRV